MTLGIIAASPYEARTLASNSVQTQKIYSLPNGVLLIISGIGQKNAHKAAKALLANGVNRLLSWGVAGGLDEKLQSGHIVLPEKIVGMENPIDIDVEWRTKLYSILTLTGEFVVNNGVCAHSETILTEIQKKAALREQTQAVAVDMESAAVGMIANEAAIPFVVLRVIADTANHTVPAAITESMNAMGNINIPQLLMYFMCRPHQIFGSVRLMRHSYSALNILSAVTKCLQPSFGWEAS